MSNATDKDVKTALELLQQVTSLRVIREFLKEKELPSSAGSWAELREKRIEGALDGALDPIDLFNLLGEVEEYGKAHIFLYHCKRDVASRLLNEEVIVATATRRGLEDRLNNPTIFDQPDWPTIAEIRYGGSGAGRFLVVKVIESRTHHKFLGETATGDKITREWEIERRRAVNVVRLSASGLLEIRLQSHTNSSRYEEDIQRIWTEAQDFFPNSGFQEYSLLKAKEWLWKNRARLKNRLRFSDSKMRNDSGNTVLAATGRAQADLFEDDAMNKSLNVFMATGGAYCDSSNVWWIAQDGGVPSADLHVLLSGRDNEFTIPANCNKEEYEYVLNQLKEAR